ncbi:hypothetical protein ACWGNF_09975 [Streptomyces sp. NPDC055808]
MIFAMRLVGVVEDQALRAVDLGELKDDRAKVVKRPAWQRDDVDFGVRDEPVMRLALQELTVAVWVGEPQRAVIAACRSRGRSAATPPCLKGRPS